MSMYRENLVNHFYWHWLESSEPFSDLPGYTRQYASDLNKIMDDYTANLRSGTLLPISHINELILFILSGRKRNHTPCCVELQKNYDLIAGEYIYCIDLPVSLKNRKTSDGKDLTPEGLVAYKAVLGCNECPVHYYCGGRCPVQAIFGSMERTRQYCHLMRTHVACVEARAGEIDRAMQANGISLQQVYDRSAFITRYTDVTP
jgi:radical SAM protein with 4Fe4S-binding SPASM domain